MSHGLPASETPVESGVAPLPAVSTSTAKSLPRAAWDHWKKVAHAVGVVQTRVLMVLFYFIAVLPIGLIMRLKGDPLHLKRPTGSNWTAHRHQDPSLNSARQQF